MTRKIVHIDMDCFYAAIEVRDDPSLKGKPVGVGGSSGRGVLTTANYEARKYGCRSAMPVFQAKQLCPEIILTPVRFDVYREVSNQVRAIFARYTDLVEPLSMEKSTLSRNLARLEADGLIRVEELRLADAERVSLHAAADAIRERLSS